MLAKFDPWVAVSGRAYRAYGAYPGPAIGTIGTLGTPPGLEISDFEERAAIISLETGLSHAQAGIEAALAAGFGSVSELHCHVIASWRDQLMSARPMSRTHAELLDLSISFTRSTWINRLVALGWDETALFAYSNEVMSAGGLMQCLQDRRLIAATRNSAVLCQREGKRSHFYRFGFYDGCRRLLWEPDEQQHTKSPARGT